MHEAIPVRLGGFRQQAIGAHHQTNPGDEFDFGKHVGERNPGAATIHRERADTLMDRCATQSLQHLGGQRETANEGQAPPE